MIFNHHGNNLFNGKWIFVSYYIFKNPYTTYYGVKSLNLFEL